MSHFRSIWQCFGAWKESFSAGHNSVADELPWLNFKAIECLQAYVKPGFKVFEYGGGGSTLFFCKAGAHVITVEDNSEWFAILKSTVAAKGYTHWEGNFISPEPVSGNAQRSHIHPADFKSNAKGLDNMSFEKYARAIDGFPPAHFDIVLVDGRARPSCIRQAIPHIKAGGWLVVDNTERAYYLQSFKDEIAAHFELVEDRFFPVRYTPDFTRTTILRKR